MRCSGTAPPAVRSTTPRSPARPPTRLKRRDAAAPTLPAARARDTMPASIDTTAPFPRRSRVNASDQIDLYASPDRARQPHWLRGTLPEDRRDDEEPAGDVRRLGEAV